MTSLAAALSEPATSALELYCVPSGVAGEAEADSRTSQTPMTELSAPRGEDRDAAEQG